MLPRHVVSTALITALQLAQVMPAYAAEAADEWTTRVAFDIKASYWFTSDDDDGDENVGHALDYQPDVIPTQALQGDLLWQGTSIFRLYYESAVSGGKADQDAVVEISEKDSSIEEINALFDLEFLKSRSPLLSRLRLDYKKHVFLGKADVQEDTDYHAASGTVATLAPAT